MKFEINIDDKLEILIREEVRDYLQKQGLLSYLREIVSNKIDKLVSKKDGTISSFNVRIGSVEKKVEKLDKIYKRIK